MRRRLNAQRPLWAFRRPWPGALLLAALLSLFGCKTGPAGERTTLLTVFAASSLREGFQDLEVLFEQEHPEVDVRLSFAGSQILRLQIEQGAGADVFASADEMHVTALSQAGLVGEIFPIATNELVVIVPAEASHSLEKFSDLPRARSLVIGTQSTPIGEYTRRVLQKAEADGRPGFSEDVLSRVVSEENNVRLVRAKVELGEVDGAIVYRTDALAGHRLNIIEIPPAVNLNAIAFAAAATKSEHAELGSAWIALARSKAGQAALRRRGFGGAP